jgi:hypothetical protein
MKKVKPKSNHWVEDIPEDDDLEIEKTLPELPQLKKKSNNKKVNHGNPKGTNIHGKVNNKSRINY